MQFLVRTFYAPVFFIGTISAAVWLIHVRHAPPWMLIALFAVALALSFCCESRFAYDLEWNRSRADTARDMAHGLVNEALNALGVCVVPLVTRFAPFPGLWPQHWPWVAQLMLAIVTADIGITLAHYLSHRVPFLWRLHAVHHSVTRMYGFNGLMKHPLHQALEAVAGTAPLLLTGMPVSIAAVLAFAISIQLLLQHSNVDMRPGPLRHVFAWAHAHRFHHMKYGDAGDVNFGLFLTVWDRLLGTYVDGDYRIGSRDLGIGTRPDYPDAYLRQLLEPFRPERASPVPAAPPGLPRRL